jgi:hypothetical protein
VKREVRRSGRLRGILALGQRRGQVSEKGEEDLCC